MRQESLLGWKIFNLWQGRRVPPVFVVISCLAWSVALQQAAFLVTVVLGDLLCGDATTRGKAVCSAIRSGHSDQPLREVSDQDSCGESGFESSFQEHRAAGLVRQSQ